MFLKKWLYEKKIDWLYRYHKGAEPSVKKDLYAALSASGDELEALNILRFRRMVAHACNYSPYYREKYRKAGLTPEDIRTARDIDSIPLLTREEIKGHREDILCRNVDRRQVFLTSTGGSTGTPVSFYHEHAEPYYYVRQRFLETIGIAPADNGAMIIRRNNTWANRCKVAFWNWPSRLEFLNARLMTRDSVHDFVDRANRAEIKFLWGYEGGIYHLGLFLAEHGLNLPSLKCVISTSSPLPLVHRRFFETVFHCDVFDQYGSCEVQWLGTECPAHHGLHMLWDIRRIEFVDSSGKNVPDGEYGDIVVTDLLNFSFPFIRYCNGDRGRRLPGSCAQSNFPLMDSVKGRTTDLVKFSDGSCIAGDYLTTIFDDHPFAVQAFQIVQKKDGTVKLLYVPSGMPEAAAEVETVVADLRKLIGGRAGVYAEKVSEIRHDGGKTRFIVSEIQ